MEGFSMNSRSKIKSACSTVILGALIASCLPSTQTEALSFAGISSWLSQNKKIVYLASIAAPIFCLYARKTIQKLINSRTRQLGDARPAEEIDYFDKFADAFGKTTALVGKIYKVVRLFSAPTDKWLDNAAGL